MDEVKDTMTDFDTQVAIQKQAFLEAQREFHAERRAAYVKPTKAVTSIIGGWFARTILWFLGLLFLVFPLCAHFEFKTVGLLSLMGIWAVVCLSPIKQTEIEKDNVK